MKNIVHIYQDHLQKATESYEKPTGEKGETRLWNLTTRIVAITQPQLDPENPQFAKECRKYLRHGEMKLERILKDDSPNIRNRGAYINWWLKHN